MYLFSKTDLNHNQRFKIRLRLSLTVTFFRMWQIIFIHTRFITVPNRASAGKLFVSGDRTFVCMSEEFRFRSNFGFFRSANWFRYIILAAMVQISSFFSSFIFSGRPKSSFHRKTWCIRRSNFGLYFLGVAIEI